MSSVYRAAKALVPLTLRERFRRAWDLRLRPALRMLTNPEAQSPPVREAVNNLIAEIQIDNLVAASAQNLRP